MDFPDGTTRDPGVLRGDSAPPGRAGGAGSGQITPLLVTISLVPTVFFRSLELILCEVGLAVCVPCISCITGVLWKPELQ